MIFRIRFAKYGVLKFIGHLDVMRYFQKVIRRSELPVRYSQGFNPHQLMSFAQPLGVGITSDGEYMEVEFDDSALAELAGAQTSGTINLGNFITEPAVVEKDIPKLEKVIFEQMAAETYEGFAIVEVRHVPYPKPNTKQEKAMSLVKAAEYAVSLKDGYSLGFESGKALLEAFGRFMEQKEISVLKKSKRGENMTDIRPFIYGFGGEECFDETGMAHADVYESGQRIFLKLAAGSVMNVRPEPVMEAFCEFIGQEYCEDAFQLHRMNLIL